MDNKRIGIDIGSLYIKSVKLKNGEVIEKNKILHKKEIIRALKEILEGEKEKFLVGFTGSISREFPLNFPFFDEIKCLSYSLKKFFPSSRYLLDIGSSSSKLLEFDERGKLKNIFRNSLCAAGTGRFIDQQMERLSLNYEEIEKWEIPEGDIPWIASRCTVFAKTDLINRQQEGYSKEKIWAGLLKSTVHGILSSLLKGRKIEGEVALAGGMVNNRFFLHYLKEKLNILYSEYSQFLGAIGAALLTDFEFKEDVISIFERILKEKEKKKIDRNPELILIKSKYPDFKELKEDLIDDVEIRIHKVNKKENLKVYLGIDIGSTSTKGVLMKENFEIVADFYTKTKGDPISAIKRIFEVITKIKEKMGFEIEILGCGTTGSGRKLIGKWIGADLIVNEITAHAKGALHFYPEAEVIFEIGGQDSKYIRLKN